MKNSILYLVIVLLTFSNMANAAHSYNNKMTLNQIDVFADTNVYGSFGTILIDSIPLPIVDTVAFDPSTVIVDRSAKSIEEIIIEYNKITESVIVIDFEFLNSEKTTEDTLVESDLVNEDKVYSFYFGKSIEEIIAENDRIIENTVSNEIRPLNFKKINRNSSLTR